jgi:hypothetical protein
VRSLLGFLLGWRGPARREPIQERRRLVPAMARMIAPSCTRTPGASGTGGDPSAHSKPPKQVAPGSLPGFGGAWWWVVGEGEKVGAGRSCKQRQ